MEPPSEWPPTTTSPPRRWAFLTTRRRSSTLTRMPHSRANGTAESGTAV